MSRLALVLTIAALGLDLGGGAPAMAGEAPAAITLSLDANQSGSVIDRHIFGQFAEHLGRGIYDGVWVGPDSKIPNTRGIRNDVVGALRAIHVPVVRWPGGCFADKYHWRNGIGPQAQRPVTLNADWGGVEEPNSFGTHEYFDFLSQIGADAYVSINVGSGTPREAAEWLNYMTSDKQDALAQERRANGDAAPFKVAFLGVGNEAWGCGGSMSADHYVEELKQFASFAVNFNAAQDKMKVAASGPDAVDYAWTETVMKAYQNHIYSWDMDALSLHRYSATETWPPRHKATGFDESDYVAVLKHTLEMEAIVAKHSAIMDRYDPQKKVALYVDEWGAWYAPEAGTNPRFLYQQNSQRDALLAGLNLDIFMRHADRVRMSNIAQMINVLQAMILTQGDQMVLTPTYYTYELYAPFQDATAIPVKFDAGVYSHNGVDLPRLDAFAARAKDGGVYLALINLDPNQPLEVDAAVLGQAVQGASGQTLTSPKIDSVNSFDAPHVVTPHPLAAQARDGKLVLKLAPESLTVVRLQ